MRTPMTAPPGGIATDEVGAITGEVEVWLAGDVAQVAYVGALDTYTVTGSPVPAGTTMAALMARLGKDPGSDDSGNARPADVRDLEG